MTHTESMLKKLQALRCARPNDNAMYWALTIAIDLGIGASAESVQADIERCERALYAQEEL